MRQCEAAAMALETEQEADNYYCDNHHDSNLDELVSWRWQRELLKQPVK